MSDIVTITLNPALDVSTSVDEVTPTHKLRCAPERREAGGGGINVARVIHCLGGQVTAVYPVGGPIGAYLQRLVSAEGVASIVTELAADTRESFTVIERGRSREYRFVLPGPHLSETEWRACFQASVSAMTGARFVVASGSLPGGAPEDAFAQLAAQAKAAGAKFALDTSGGALAAALDVGVCLVKPNLRELTQLLGPIGDDQASLLSAARQLLEAGRAEIVALSLGARGALLATREAAWAGDAIPVEVSSSVGAGDSFLGALVWAIDAGRDLPNAFSYALAGGAAALLRAGPGLCRAEDVDRLLGEAKVRQL